ncbi:MAG: alcohol dehydrogenase catalytic domain-containing protein, partial [Caulobacter sp.]|nr:alcohol dehydrogenase catalytic domain-containing protein [Caulobacter sp.]
MKIVGFRELLPATDPNALLDLEAPDPAPTGHDILVRVKAVSVNPVDTKVRSRAQPAEGEVRVLGYDAAGVVEAVGDAVTLFSPGDEVFYAGAIGRQGSNAELQLVDERIVGRKPKSLDYAQAAAMPLTFITAWELLFDRFGVARDGGEGQTLVIIGGAGGVGSAMLQLARKLTKRNVVASASREE